MKQFSRLLFASFCTAAALFAEEPPSVGVSAASGEEAIAARYAEWADTALREKRYAEAEAFLLRAADYGVASSDLSYLLAVVKKERLSPVREWLAAARLALATDRWTLYSRRDAVYIEAEALIRLSLYNEALNALSELGEDEYAEELRLRAMYSLPEAVGFDAVLGAALDRYPYNPAFLRILFRRVVGKSVPTDSEKALVDTALRRLPALLETSGELIRYAAPFIADRDEARRLLASWLESGGAERAERVAALPLCLDAGITGEEEAIDELFYTDRDSVLPVIDRDTLLAVWELLRTDEARDAFSRRLTSFSGTITLDENGDETADSRAVYRNGALTSYSRDENQDGVDELLAAFESGWPVSAELDYAGGGGFEAGLGMGNGGKVSIVWEKYPALREAERGGERYFFRPMEFNYPAVRFQTLGGPGGILFPLPENGVGMFTDHLLLAADYRIERPYQ